VRASEHGRPDVAAERIAYGAAMADLDPARLVFLDESGIKTNMTRTYARAPVGVRAVGAAPVNWKRLKLLGALSLDGIAGAMTVPSGTTAVVFLDFLKTTVLPFLAEHKPDALLVMDNLSAHKNKEVQEMISAAGMTLQYLPRYSPDFSPIEACWSKIKTALRAKAARTVETLRDAFADAVATITAQDARAWFAHCGYPISA
jgi:DDE superfamily endonuclease